MRFPCEHNRICGVSDEPEPGSHSHLCGNCRTCWVHSTELSMDPSLGREAYNAAHRCPNCGAEQFYKHRNNSTDEQEAILELMEEVIAGRISRAEAFELLDNVAKRKAAR